MNITRARKIAKLVGDQKFKGFRDEIRAAFHRLHKNANKGHREDRKLAQVIWTHVGTWT